MKISLNEQFILARIMKNSDLPPKNIRELTPRQLEILLISLASAKLDNLANKIWKYYHGEEATR